MSFWQCCCTGGGGSSSLIRNASNWGGYDAGAAWLDSCTNFSSLGINNDCEWGKLVTDTFSPPGTVYAMNGHLVFTNITIAQATTIDSAILNFPAPYRAQAEVDWNKFSGLGIVATDAPPGVYNAVADFYLEDADDLTASSYSTATAMEALTRTTASTSVTIWFEAVDDDMDSSTDSIDYQYDGTAFADINITTAVQEVLNRSGWSSGNDMRVLIDTDAANTDQDIMDGTSDEPVTPWIRHSQNTGGTYTKLTITWTP